MRGTYPVSHREDSKVIPEKQGFFLGVTVFLQFGCSKDVKEEKPMGRDNTCQQIS